MSIKKQGLWLAILCAAGAVAMRLLAPGDLLLYALALPFELAGRGLRALSLSGGALNVLALALYLPLCLAPVLEGLWRKRRGKTARHWGMRALLSLSLLYVLYLFINPADIQALFGPIAQGEGLLACKIMLAGALWSMGLAWWALTMLGRAERLDLYNGLALLLKIAGACLIVYLFYSRLYALTGCVQSTGVRFYSESGAEIAGLAAMSLSSAGFSPYEFDWPGIIRIAADALPAIFLLLLVLPGLDLLHALRQDPYAQEVPALCGTVAEKARAVVYACVASMVGSNLLQLLFTGGAGGMSVHIGIRLPLLELGLAFMLLLLAEGSRRNRELKLDNESIV